MEDFSNFLSQQEGWLEKLKENLSAHWQFVDVARGFVLKAFFSQGLERLVWSCAAIEALLREDTDGLTRLLRSRIDALHPEKPALGKRFVEENGIYDIRSRLVHGATFERKVYQAHCLAAFEVARSRTVEMLMLLDHVLTWHRQHHHPELPSRKDTLFALDQSARSQSLSLYPLAATVPTFLYPTST
jgi:hypothetical protein